MPKITWGNPFTHEEHTRESVSTRFSPRECYWCGNGRLSGRKTLYKYDNSKGLFCNKDCYRAYYS